MLATEGAPAVMDSPDRPTDASRPTWACLLHRPPTDDSDRWVRADPGYRTCSPCLDRLRERLAEVATRYHLLDSTPGASGDRGRGAPGFGSRASANEHIVVLRDPRSSQVAKVWVGADGRVHRETERPPVSVRGELDTLAWSIADDRGIGGPHDRANVSALVRWVDQQLDYATRSDLVVEVGDVVRRLLAQLRPATGDGRRRIGRCPNTLDRGDDVELCDAPLFAPTAGDTIRCGACGRPWPRQEWERLGQLLTAA